ncbi:hypothetical protein HHX47_DHR1000894 [Lentinula edodes]|nr:hypothetical protein HHX47_DHR1000894 [Lentinula edodes]
MHVRSPRIVNFFTRPTQHSLKVCWASYTNYSHSTAHRTFMASPTRSFWEPSKVLVFGAGNFGSCLADHLGDSDHNVYLWSRQEEVVKSLNEVHRNPIYLKDHQFSVNITAVGPELPGKTLIDDMDVLLFAIPTQFLRENLAKLQSYLDRKNHPLLIFVNKGIEIGTHALTLEIIADTCGTEIAKAATFISFNVNRHPYRYTGSDPIGTELAGALKNVYAIAAGAADGLGFENNTRATLRPAEIIRLGSIAEGVTTAKGVKMILDELGIKARIATTIYEVLYEASSEGRLEEVQDLLRTASNADVNVKDQNGITPLIEAVKNGHVEVVHALLAHGADPMSASHQGPPQAYTQDPTMLEILNSAQVKIVSLAPPNETGFYSEANGDPYAPAVYPYYPPYTTSPPEGPVYYSPPPPQLHADGQSMTALGPGNLPPPEIARLIPCRYFPACRYGASCLFAHPQGPYLSGPLPPPAQYPAPYDPMNTSYPPNDYYSMSTPSFQQPSPNGMNIISSPNGAPVVQPEMFPPPHPFSPNGVPQVPFTAVSPVGEPAPYLPQPPMSAAPPQIYHQPPPPQPSTMYNNTSVPAPPFVVQSNGMSQYPPIPASAPVGYSDGVVDPPSLNPQSETFGSIPTGPPASHRESTGHARRSSIRRGSFTTRKPPCLFFPAGKCKNGDDCRFPHILLNDYPSPPHSYAAGRGGAFRAPRGHPNHNSVGNGLDAKMADLTIRDTRPQNGHPAAPVKIESKDGNRPRPGQGYKNASNKRPPPIKQQRVPNADEFPTLGNLASPPPKSSSVYFSNGNGHSGPTAAQVLQAPPPRRDSESFPSVNGTRTPSDSGSVKDSDSSIAAQSSSTSVIQKLPISFAAIAATSAPEVAAEVSVSA